MIARASYKIKLQKNGYPVELSQVLFNIINLIFRYTVQHQ